MRDSEKTAPTIPEQPAPTDNDSSTTTTTADLAVHYTAALANNYVHCNDRRLYIDSISIHGKHRLPPT
jgi:hypothetical protein